MRLSISNIAWDTVEDEAVATLLQSRNVNAIDIAPGKYFPVAANASKDDLIAVKSWWAERGIQIVGMQALLFGLSGVNVFGTPAVQDALLQHLKGVCRVGAGIGATRLVFGSPKNRDRSGLDDEQALDIGTRFFRRLGDIAADHDVIVCLEPNPVHYGANFMVNSLETRTVVECVDHPAIRMQLDSGALAMNDEDPAATIRECASLIGHVHASEPGLIPLGDANCPHAMVADAIREHLPGHIVTVEMVATSNEPHLRSIERALRVATQHYGPDGSEVHA
ncbi:xylose isomerase [Paraburkholderia monticola]|uniref:Xylose isomerase n=1 Tax=Paraburkholderia monticola TaxID=1399968 RepID=A0A149Q0U0_9BURK|nr:sugar phosphate isomerase/epimerase [Paraburkholderia monticola]KXU90938.1 xylose isomerase [Paraburkholderia monticola]